VLEVDRNALVEELRRHVLELVAEVVRGVIDQRQRRPVLLREARDRRPVFLDIGDVAVGEAGGEAGVPELLLERGAAIGHDVDEADLAALRGELAHQRLADPRSATGNNNRHALEAGVARKIGHG
jgi:hypothetical protein